MCTFWAFGLQSQFFNESTTGFGRKNSGFRNKGGGGFGLGDKERRKEVKCKRKPKNPFERYVTKTLLWVSAVSGVVQKPNPHTEDSASVWCFGG